MIKKISKEKIQVQAPAKINLTLNVLGKREDGYHSLETVMQTVSIYDSILLSKRKEQGITLATNLPFLPLDEKNLAFRAAKAVFDHVGMRDYGVEVFIKKYIPVGAGLAGGSTDAAAAIVGLNELYQLSLTQEEMMSIGLKLGADVPFCMCKGTYLATGIGEILEKLPNMPYCTIVVAKPRRGISTPHLFTRLDEIQDYAHPSAKALVGASPKGVREFAKHLGNSFEALGKEENGQIVPMLEDLQKYGALNSIMTGSGSAVYGLFQTTNYANRCVKEMRAKYKGCFVTVCCPIYE